METYNQISPAYFIDYMMRKGWTFDQSLGLANNVKAESNFGYDRFQGDKTVPLYTKDTGYGLAQWTNKARKSKFAELFGVELDKSTPEQQMDFLDWELRNTEKAAGDKLAKTTNAVDASRIITTDFERPANKFKEAEARLTSLDTLKGKITDVMGGVVDTIGKGSALGNVFKAISFQKMTTDGKTMGEMTNEALTSPFTKYWSMGVIIVGSIALIMAGGYMRGASTVIKGIK